MPTIFPLLLIEIILHTPFNFDFKHVHSLSKAIKSCLHLYRHPTLQNATRGGKILPPRVAYRPALFLLRFTSYATHQAFAVMPLPAPTIRGGCSAPAAPLSHCPCLHRLRRIAPSRANSWQLPASSRESLLFPVSLALLLICRYMPYGLTLTVNKHAGERILADMLFCSFFLSAHHSFFQKAR